MPYIEVTALGGTASEPQLAAGKLLLQGYGQIIFDDTETSGEVSLQDKARNLRSCAPVIGTSVIKIHGETPLRPQNEI